MNRANKQTPSSEQLAKMRSDIQRATDQYAEVAVFGRRFRYLKVTSPAVLFTDVPAVVLFLATLVWVVLRAL